MATGGDSHAAWAVNEGALHISVDEAVYSRDALLRTCYWFTERAYVFVSRSKPGIFEVQLRLKRATLAEPDPGNLDDIGGEFVNQLLDHQLRQDIEAQTGRIRELLVAKAFAEAGVLEDDPPGDADDPVIAKQNSIVRINVGG